MNKSFIILIALALFACSDDSAHFMDTGTLTGYDYRYCACCGGIFIEIRGSTYRFFELPQNSNISLDASTKFPVKVFLSWKERSNGCAGNSLIDIIEIARL